jgi:hypothetical protein
MFANRTEPNEFPADRHAERSAVPTPINQAWTRATAR